MKEIYASFLGTNPQNSFLLNVFLLLLLAFQSTRVQMPNILNLSPASSDVLNRKFD